jgi:flagellar protein FliS
MSKHAMKAYGQKAREIEIDAASPHRLIAMLLDGALVAIGEARLHCERDDVPRRGRAISRAIAIVTQGLRASLDRSADGEIASNLDRLYDYATRRLIEANRTGKAQALDEALGVLQEVKGAWGQIA